MFSNFVEKLSPGTQYKLFLQFTRLQTAIRNMINPRSKKSSNMLQPSQGYAKYALPCNGKEQLSVLYYTNIFVGADWLVRK